MRPESEPLRGHGDVGLAKRRAAEDNFSGRRWACHAASLPRPTASPSTRAVPTTAMTNSDEQQRRRLYLSVLLSLGSARPLPPPPLTARAACRDRALARCGPGSRRERGRRHHTSFARVDGRGDEDGGACDGFDNKSDNDMHDRIAAEGGLSPASPPVVLLETPGVETPGAAGAVQGARVAGVALGWLPLEPGERAVAEQSVLSEVTF